MDSRVRLSAVLLFLVGLTVLSGCIFSPERKKAVPPPPPPKYLAPITPGNVLRNLIDAYVARDSAGTDSCYDTGYVGTSVDLSLPQPIPSFSKTDEVRHVGRLRLDPNIVSVYLDLGSQGNWQVLDGNPSDPPGYKIIQITNQVVRIEDVSRATTWQSQNQIIEYTFKPTDVPDVPDDQDTTWTIVKWTEFAN